VGGVYPQGSSICNRRKKKKIEREQEAVKLRVLFKSLDLFLRFTGMREREREREKCNK
jgi:hypothetical protein